LFPSRPHTAPLTRFQACLGLCLALACVLLSWSGRVFAGPNDAAAQKTISDAMD